MLNKVETIEEFYKRKFDWMPENIRSEIDYQKLESNLYRRKIVIGFSLLQSCYLL